MLVFEFGRAINFRLLVILGLRRSTRDGIHGHKYFCQISIGHSSFRALQRNSD